MAVSQGIAPCADILDQACLMYYLFFAGVGVLAVILLLFWLKDVLQSPKLARIVYSELVARFALMGAAFLILGLLLIVGEYLSSAGN